MQSTAIFLRDQTLSDEQCEFFSKWLLMCASLYLMQCHWSSLAELCSLYHCCFCETHPLSSMDTRIISEADGWSKLFSKINILAYKDRLIASLPL